MNRLPRAALSQSHSTIPLYSSFYQAKTQFVGDTLAGKKKVDAGAVFFPFYQIVVLGGTVRTTYRSQVNRFKDVRFSLGVLTDKKY
jgi:hypothetical protein